MKKKFLTLLLAVCCILPCSMVLTACGGGESNTAHTHKFDSWMYDEADTTQHYHSCECGETEYEDHTFTYDTTSSTDMHWATCSACGYEKSEAHTYLKGICACGEVAVTDCLTYEYVDQSYRVTGINLGWSNDLDYIRIPAFYDDGENGQYSVTKIADYAFRNASNFEAKKVIIPNTVTVIGASAFKDCDTIEEIQIANVYAGDTPSELYFIGENAFEDCTNLTTINLPESLTVIADYAFAGCTKLENLTLPSTRLAGISQYAFSGCTSLKNLTLPNSLTTIGDYAFKNCESFTSIHFPNSITTIGTRKKYEGSEETYVDSSTAHILFGCKNLETITADAPIMSSGFYAQGNCLIEKRSGTIIEGIKTSVIPNDCWKIAEYAFYEIDELKNINIPKSVATIDNKAFYGCKNLESITVSSENENYSAVNNCLIDKSTNTLILGCKNSTIPDDGSVTIIWEEAFAYCEGLTSLVVPECVTKINRLAFKDCENLKTLTLPFIGIDAENSGGNGLLDLFSYYSHSSNVVPVETVTITQGTTVPSKAFSNCRALKTITLPDTITSIGDDAFYYCSNLTNLTIPSGVTSIGDGAFYCCNKLNNITLPTGITTISKSLFSYCSNLQTLTIPNSVTTIGYYAFSSCSSLNNITLPSGLTSLGQSAFSNCTSLTKITIPASVTTINDNLFKGCSKLSTVILEEGITTIGKGAFNNCSNFTLVLPTTATNIDREAFSTLTSDQNIKFFFNGDSLAWNDFKNTLSQKDNPINGIFNFKETAVYYYSQYKLSASGKYWHYVNGIPVSW